MLKYNNGVPIYWRYLNWEGIEKAISAYFEPYATAATEPVPEIDEEHLDALKRYLSYWIEAPVWRANPAATQDNLDFLYSLIESVPSLANRSEISVFIAKCLQIGLDPF
ncbi:MAG: hypothetical protein AAGM45_02015 [Cyanobacteria bacterium J06588_5]